jgi:hypothetical protein
MIELVDVILRHFWETRLFDHPTRDLDKISEGHSHNTLHTIGRALRYHRETPLATAKAPGDLCMDVKALLS